jgi:hypothetical protein
VFRASSWPLTLVLAVLLAVLPVAGVICDADCDAAASGLAAMHEHGGRGPMAHHHHGAMPPRSPTPAPLGSDHCGHDHVSTRTAVAATKSVPLSIAVSPLSIGDPGARPAGPARVHPHRPPLLRSPDSLVLRI